MCCKLSAPDKLFTDLVANASPKPGAKLRAVNGKLRAARCQLAICGLIHCYCGVMSFCCSEA